MTAAGFISTGLSAFLGFFFLFAGVSKTTDLTPASGEMQSGFRNGVWGALWGLPSVPFLKFVGVTEILTGLGLWAYVAGLAPQVLAQWSAFVPVGITVAATTSHVLNGDPSFAITFCGVITTLFLVNNFAMAAYFASIKATKVA
eukprot:CAMPEP_0197427920 /NCGR_PEP_ID=MMETSP1170-20131217/39682_1 /TAXON_ID=54406 /ORGANISM="Sarcinochrysis sp, Strain CCMP770" /LENGTH=143 /DNA_ID=CAMNT_0042955639 /DNA_START=27 /DNA_END=458 /DNA_ORIENTATION=-